MLQERGHSSTPAEHMKQDKQWCSPARPTVWYEVYHAKKWSQ